MDDVRFDAWTLALTAAGSRRTLVRTLLGGTLGTLGGWLGGGREAAAGDREAGQPCKRNAQCITEVCRGPRDRKTCRCADGLKACPTSSNNCCVDPLVCRDGACVNHCQSGRKDRDESDVDCGGANCPGCEFGHTCNSPDDCVDGLFFCRDRAGDSTAKKVCLECANSAVPADDACASLHGDDRPFCVRNKCRQCRDEVDCAQGEECNDGTCTGTCLPEGAPCTIAPDGSDPCCTSPEVELSCISGTCLT